jgi:predicted RNA binding protein YcfA (HicA-like mRNA interferase family)
MAEYGRKVRQELTANGCYFKRQGKGSHEIWYSPIIGGTISVPKEIKSRHTANEVLKESGVMKLF